MDIKAKRQEIREGLSRICEEHTATDTYDEPFFDDYGVTAILKELDKMGVVLAVNTLYQGAEANRNGELDEHQTTRLVED